MYFSTIRYPRPQKRARIRRYPSSVSTRVGPKYAHSRDVSTTIETGMISNPKGQRSRSRGSKVAEYLFYIQWRHRTLLTFTTWCNHILLTNKLQSFIYLLTKHFYVIVYYRIAYRQLVRCSPKCFDTVGWATGRAFGL